MTDDDQFERDLRSAIRDGAPELAPATLRRDVETALAAPPMRPRRHPWTWLAGAVAAAVVIVATAIVGSQLIRQPAATLAAPSTGTALATLAPTSPQGETPEPAPTEHALPEPILHPGFIQIGELMTVTDGWAQNADGHVFLTHSSGAAWRDITPPELATQEQAAHGVASEVAPHFLDGQRGWIMRWIDPSDPGAKLDIDWWRTSDAGLTWVHSVLHDARGLPNDFGWFNANAGWLVTDPPGKVEPLLRWTNDGGSTWSEPVDLRQASGTSSIEWVKFVDPATGFLGTGGSILRTIDSGGTWTPVELPQPTSADAARSGAPVTLTAGRPVQFVDGTHGFLLIDVHGSDGVVTTRRIYTTDSAGASWRLALDDDLARHWAFVDAGHWIGTDGLDVWSTSDGGASFNAGPTSGLPSPIAGFAATFVDPIHGWASAIQGCPPGHYCALTFEALVRTSDGGQTWSFIGDCGKAVAVPCPSWGTR